MYFTFPFLQYLAINFLSWRSYSEQPPKVFYNEVVLKKFELFTGKHLRWSLFLKKLKRKLQHRCFLMNIAKFLREHFWRNICQQLFLSIPTVFLYLGFLSRTSKIPIVSVTTLYHFHPLHRQLDISQTITAERTIAAKKRYYSKWK